MLTLILAIIVNFFFTSFFMVFIYEGLVHFFPALPLTNEAYLIAALLMMTFLGGLGLTPMGEGIFRFMNGARRPNDEEKEHLEPIFSGVAERCGFLRSQFDLCVIDDMGANAFALGRRTVAITRGSMRLPQEEQEAVFAHELGHMRHGDSVILIVFYMLTSASRIMLNILSRICAVLCHVPYICILAAICSLMLKAAWYFVMMPINIGERFGGRMREYRADRFAHEKGYGEGLLSFMRRLLEVDVPQKGVMDFLMSSHPPPGKRIKRLEKLEAGTTA